MRKIAILAIVFAADQAIANPLHDIVTKGSTDRSVVVEIIDLADGSPETGVVFNTSGIDLWYRREGAALVSVTEATLAALTTAHTDGGFLAIANGSYRLDLPDAAFATGANYVDFGGTVTGMVVIGGRVRLVDYSLEDAVRGTTGTAVPNAAAGASGGLLISGSNSGTTTFGAVTVTGATTLTGNVSMAAGLNITQSSANTPALVVTGNGTGNGATITSGSGATGTGLAVVSAATNGSAVTLAGVGTGNGLTATGGATGHGISGVGGATSGNGIRAVGTAGNSAAMNLVGQGSAAGLLTTGGATGHGLSAVGGATSGAGISSVASTSGAGIVATGVGTTQAGIAATGGSTSSAGISAAGGGTGSGILATGGATGHGMRLVGGATSGNGISTSFTAPSAGAPEFGFAIAGTLSGTHSSTTADLGTNAPGTVSDVVGQTIYFPTRHLSRSPTAYDTATGIATFAAIDADITLTNADPWILYGTSPGSASGGPTAAEIADAVLDEDMTAHQTQGTLGQAIGDPAADTDTIFAKVNEIEDQTDDIGVAGAGLTATDDAIMTRVGAPVGASISADIAAVESGISWNSAWDAEVQSEANDAIVANLLDQLLLNTYNPATPPGATDSLLEDLLENDAGVTRFSSNALEQAPTAGGGNMTQIEGVDATDAIDARVAASLATYDPPTRAELTTDTNSVLTAVADVPTNAELATALGTADDAVLARLGTPAGASVSADVAAIEDQTDDIGVAGAGLTSRASQSSVDDIPTNAELATSQAAADDATLAAIAALPAAIRDTVIEDQGGGITLGCALAVAAAYAAGDIATSGVSTTYEESSGTETRITGTAPTAGNRTATITCPTY